MGDESTIVSYISCIVDRWRLLYHAHRPTTSLNHSLLFHHTDCKLVKDIETKTRAPFSYLKLSSALKASLNGEAVGHIVSSFRLPHCFMSDHVTTRVTDN